MSQQPESMYDAIEQEMRENGAYRSASGPTNKTGRQKPTPAEDKLDTKHDTKHDKEAAPVTRCAEARELPPPAEITVMLNCRWGQGRINAVEVVGSTLAGDGLIHLLVRPNTSTFIPAPVTAGEVVKFTMSFPDEDREDEEVVCLGKPVMARALNLDIITYAPYTAFDMEKNGSISDDTPVDDRGIKDEDVTATQTAAKDFDTPRK